MSARGGEPHRVAMPGTVDGPAAPPPHAGADGVPDAGVVRNTVLQLAAQVTGVIFTGALTLYLVRALGPSGYGLYALAISIAGLLVLPAGLGLPMAVGRFVADNRGELRAVREILGLGMKLQVPAAAATGVVLFAAAGALADAYGHPALGWPLRWAALSVIGQAMFSFLTSVATSVRQARVGLWMAIVESVSETIASVSLVLAGAGVAGATLGKAAGYGIGVVAGLALTARLLRGRLSEGAARRRVSPRMLLSYAGVMFVVDLSFSALSQLDVLLIGALLSTAAVGSFSAIWRILVVLGYLGVAVSGGVAPRLSLRGGAPDTRAFNEAIRYLMIIQGVVVAPMLVWSGPIVRLLLGPRYAGSAEVLRVLTVVAFVSPPAALISASVTYMGEARRRVAIVLATLVLGFVCIYALIRAVGLVGAAIGDDVIVVVYVAAHLWICARLTTVDFHGLSRSCLRTLLAAAAMALPLLAFGTGRLSAAQWILGLASGAVVYVGVLLLTRELSAGELRMLAGRVRAGLARPA